MATPRTKEFTVRVTPPVKGEPQDLTDENSWCWKLLEDNGAALHPAVRHALYPGIGLKGRGVSKRRALYAACVCHVIVQAVEDHRVSPTYQAIAEALNDAGVLTWGQRPWTRQMVYILLSRKGLTGVLAKHRHVNNLAFALRLAERPHTANRVTLWPS